MGDCLLWAVTYIKIAEVAHIFVLLSSTYVHISRISLLWSHPGADVKIFKTFSPKVYALIWTKNGLGCILGNFLSNWSGHPAFSRVWTNNLYKKRWLSSRVTRLIEFSPIGRLFSLGVSEIAQIYGLLFPKVCICSAFILTKKRVGLHMY
jgi:hypothetical protein